MYKINRFYLLFSLVFSLVAPIYEMELPMTIQETQLSPEIIAYILANPQLLEQESGWNYGELLNLIYGIIGLGLFFRFVFNIFSLIYRIKQDEKFETQEITFVLDDKTDQPFSFLHYIFLPQENYDTIHPNLIQHEKAHCIQKHSWDIVFIEIFQIVFWFNPFIYLYKKSIKLNHEFLADEYVLQNDVDVKIYQHQILDCIAAQSQNSVASHFNFILTKKRLLMMTKHTSKRKARILSFASFPFILSAFVLFSQKTFAQEVNNSAKSVEKVLEKEVENPIKEVITLNIDSPISDTIKTKKFKILNNNFTLTDKDLGDINPNDIKHIKIENQNNAIVTLKSGETKEIKLKELPEKNFKINDNGEILGESKFSISNADQLKNIDPKEIKSIVVGKDRNFLQVIKKNNDTIKFNVESKFKASNSKILKLDELSTNEILTPTIKAKLKDLDIKNFAGIEMLNRNGTKVIQVEDKILVFDSKDKLINQSSVPSKNEMTIFSDNIVYNSKNNSIHTFDKNITKDQQKAIVEAHEKIKTIEEAQEKLKDNPWKIEVKPHSESDINTFKVKSYSATSFYIPDGEKTKEQIAKELDQLKSKEKETKKRIKALEKQQKKLK
ncbi:MAG TPA: M56 family metallopeptidase [Faecalibacter sp.]